MEKKRYFSPTIDIIKIDGDQVICTSGPEPVDKINKSSDAFGFDSSEVI